MTNGIYYKSLDGTEWILKDDDVVAELAALRAEVERLREAVEWACMLLSKENREKLRKIARMEE